MERHRILLIEDNDDSRIVYKTALEHFGHDVLEAADGETGIRVAEREVPDLILLDLSLPRINGYQVAMQLKNDPRTKEIPIIAVSANVFSDHRELAERAGCDAFLAKPILPRDLYEEVKTFISRRMQGDAPDARAADSMRTPESA
jgi:two-component system cell cycle response regulator DivK